ncbi:MAG TPA: ABC transporter permease [Polyangiales bacterium]
MKQASLRGTLLATESSRPSRLGQVVPWERLRAVPWTTAVSIVVVAWVVAFALVPEWLAPYAATDMDPAAILSPPSRAHWFGTDQFGRDVLSSVIYGARQSLSIGLLAVGIGGSLGVTLGTSAGYLGGVIDMILMRLVDVWLAIPNMLLAIALCAALGPSWFTIVLAVSLSSVPRFARVLRARALSLRSRPFVMAARAAGASRFVILRDHILPHCLPPMLVMATLGIGSSILIGAALSFLGLGVNEERPDWGYLLTQGRGYLSVAWWSVTYPGLAISALVISVNLLGDKLRRVVDPRAQLEP